MLEFRITRIIDGEAIDSSTFLVPTFDEASRLAAFYGDLLRCKVRLDVITGDLRLDQHVGTYAYMPDHDDEGE